MFTHEQSEKEYKVYLTDLNVSTARYNLFYLIEGVDVNFRYFGDYEYKVFQMPDGLSEDTDLGVQVEVGKMRLIEVDEVINSYVTNNIANIYVS